MAKPLISSRFVRRLVILGTPLFLATLGFRYPTGFTADIFHSLLPDVDRWLAFQLAQIFLLGLLALAIYLIVEDLQGWQATVTRVAAGIFVLFRTARDTVSGLAVGVLIDNAREFSPEHQVIVARSVQKLFFDPLIGGGLSMVSVIGTLGWLVAVLAAAGALYRTGAPLTPVLFLILAAVLFGVTAAPPFGPLGMVCFSLAGLKLEWRKGKTTDGELGRAAESAAEAVPRS